VVLPCHDSDHEELQDKPEYAPPFLTLLARGTVGSPPICSLCARAWSSRAWCARAWFARAWSAHAWSAPPLHVSRGHTSRGFPPLPALRCAARDVIAHGVLAQPHTVCLGCTLYVLCMLKCVMHFTRTSGVPFVLCSQRAMVHRSRHVSREVGGWDGQNFILQALLRVCLQNPYSMRKYFHF
jgi:hypothetical protein